MIRISTTVLLICISLLLLPLFSHQSLASASPSDLSTYNPLKKDAYDPNLYRELQSINDLVTYINDNFKGNKRSTEFVNYMARVVSRRFYHGYSYYSLKDNWIAAIAGKLIWDHLSAIVLPEDIMKYPYAACSQQSVVLMECAKRFGLAYRKVGFYHHYALEVKSEEGWHYIDANMEVIPEKGSLESLMKSGSFDLLYDQQIGKNNRIKWLKNPELGEVDADPAPRAELFQNFTYFISKNFLLFLFLALFYLFKKYWDLRESFLKKNTV